MKVQWTEDKISAQQMKVLDMKFKYVTGFHTRDIDVEASKRNNARQEAPLNELAVNSYMGYMNAGNLFAGIVVYLPLKIVLSGNHRLTAAMLLDQVTIDCHVVTEASPEAIQDFIAWANAKETRVPLTESDLINKAAEMVIRETDPKSIMEATMYMFGTAAFRDKVADRHRELAVRRDLLKADVAPAAVDKVVAANPTVLKVLYPLSPTKMGGVRSEKLLVEAFSAIKKHELNQTRAEEMIKAARENTKDEREQIRAIGDYVENLKARKEKKNVPAVRPECIEFRKAVGFMYSVLCSKENPTFRQFHVPQADQKELIEKLRAIKRAINSLERS
jgi:hypothetical protein